MGTGFIYQENDQTRTTVILIFEAIMACFIATIYFLQKKRVLFLNFSMLTDLGFPLEKERLPISVKQVFCSPKKNFENRNKVLCAIIFMLTFPVLGFSHLRQINMVTVFNLTRADGLLIRMFFFTGC